MMLYQSVLTRYDIDMYILIVFTEIEIKTRFCSFISFVYCTLTIDANMYFYWYFITSYIASLRFHLFWIVLHVF